MSSLRRPPSRWGIVPRTLFFVGAIVLGLGLFFGLLAGALALRVAWEKQADKDWKPPVEDPAEAARRAEVARGTPVAALAPTTAPTLVAKREPQPLALWAQQATLNGRGVSLGGKRDRVIEGWRSDQAVAAWAVDPAAGEYHVDVTYAARSDEGGDFTVTVGGQTLKGRAVPTAGSGRGGRRGTTFNTVRLATIQLPEGATRLEVKPAGLPNNALMSLLRVDLIPPGAPGANAAVAMADVSEDDGSTAADREEEKKNERRRRAAEQAVAMAEEKAKQKTAAAEREAAEKAERIAKQEAARREAEERKAKREAERMEQERTREARRRNEREREAADAAKPPRPAEALTLIDADNGRVIERLRDGATINLAALPRGRLSVRAEVAGNDAQSVRFGFAGRDDFHTEEEAPFIASGGSAAGVDRPLPIAPGSHTITATTYAGPKATGAAGKPLRVTFTAIDEPKPAPAGGAVTGLTLIDTERNVPLRPLPDGSEIDLGALSAKKLTIAAETAGAVSSLRFELDGGSGKAYRHVEDNAPYTLNGDTDGRYWAYEDLKPGKYRLRAIPFAEDGAKGPEGRPLKVKFEVLAAGAREPLILKANGAKLEGKSLRAEGDSLFDWTDDDATATWAVKPPAAGKYAVELVYANPRENAGGQFELTIGGHRFTGTASPTDHATDFKTFKLGELALQPQETPARLKAINLKDGNRPLMTLKEIRLTPVR